MDWVHGNNQNTVQPPTSKIRPRLNTKSLAQAYSEPFGIGAGPPDADPEVAYGVADRYTEAISASAFLVSRW